jgi:hypothetical protein
MVTSSRVLRFLFAGAVALGLSHCGPSPEAVAAASAVSVPAGEGATIKVYRSFSSPAGTAARIYLDDAFLGYVSARSQNTFHVKPGSYRITAKFPSGFMMFPQRARPFTIAKGETRHFGIGFTGGGEFVAVSSLVPLDEGSAALADKRFPSRE